MDDKENVPKQMLSCKSRGPGPAYILPSLVGYYGHDPSRYRNPAYTIPGRLGQNDANTPSPGPQYNIGKLTNYGLDNPPSFSLAGREKFKGIGFGPGPGAYHPETVPPMNHSLRPPAYTIKSRSMIKLTGDGPGPNSYILPSCLGPNVPHKTAQGAFTILGRNGKTAKTSGPGPAAYADRNYDLLRKRNPAYTLKWRQKNLAENSASPGPAYYPKFNTGKNQPMYTFGIRHSDCAPPAITDDDD